MWVALAVAAAALALFWLLLFHPFGAAAVRREPAPPREPETRAEGRLETVFFPARDGARLEGWLFTPRRAGRAPLVLMAPGLTGTKEGPLERFAWAFAGAGLAVLAFDFRSFGGSDGAPRHHVDPFRQAEDYEAALDFVRERLRDDPRVDVTRVALWGSSFSGGVATAVASRRGDVAALVAQAPYLATPESQQPGPLRMPIYVAATVLDLLRARAGAALSLPLPPVYLPAFGVPGEFAFATSRENPSRHDASLRGVRFWQELPPRLRGGWGNALLARFLADFDRFRPLEAIASLRCAVLLVAAARDDLVPLAQVEQAFARVGHARKRLLVHECGHFELYTEPCFEQNAAAQARFLLEALASAKRRRRAREPAAKPSGAQRGAAERRSHERAERSSELIRAGRPRLGGAHAAGRLRRLRGGLAGLQPEGRVDRNLHRDLLAVGPHQRAPHRADRLGPRAQGHGAGGLGRGLGLRLRLGLGRVGCGRRGTLRHRGLRKGPHGPREAYRPAGRPGRARQRACACM